MSTYSLLISLLLFLSTLRRLLVPFDTTLSTFILLFNSCLLLVYFSSTFIIILTSWWQYSLFDVFFLWISVKNMNIRFGIEYSYSCTSVPIGGNWTCTVTANCFAPSKNPPFLLVNVMALHHIVIDEIWRHFICIRRS